MSRRSLLDYYPSGFLSGFFIRGGKLGYLNIFGEHPLKGVWGGMLPQEILGFLVFLD